jgi:AraC-like DNA-binding protein
LKSLKRKCGLISYVLFSRYCHYHLPGRSITGKKNKPPADILLIIWLIVIAIHLFLFYLFITGKIYDYPILMGHLPYPLLHGPFLFLYTTALTRQPAKFKSVWLIHFIPILVLYLFLIPFFLLPPAEKINVYRNKGAGYETLMAINLISIFVSGIAYIVASLVLLRRYRRSIKDEFSNIEKINLAWLRYLVYGLAVIWMAVIFGNDSIVFGIAVLFVFFLGYFGIRQTGVFITAQPQPVSQQIAAHEEKLKGSAPPDQSETLPDEIPVRPEPSGIVTKIKYEKSGLAEDQAGKIYEQLGIAMSKQKLFTESELTLAALAKTLDVHPNHLSQVINSYEGKNFYDFINFHRVEEFKRLAPRPDNQNYTLLSMAYECGFNSKTSFNRNFRKVTGISPSEYLLQQHISLK